MHRAIRVVAWNLAAGTGGAILVTVLAAFLGSDLAGTVALDAPPPDEHAWFDAAQARVAPDATGTVLRFGRLRQDAAVEIDQFVSYGSAGAVIVFRCRAGWPFRSATGAQWIINVPGGQSSEVRTDGVIVHRSAWFSERLVPWHPDWPGLLGNVLLFSAMCAVTGIIVRQGRRSLRRRCGRCPGCGYLRHRDGAEDCPECGGR